MLDSVLDRKLVLVPFNTSVSSLVHRLVKVILTPWVFGSISSPDYQEMKMSENKKWEGIRDSTLKKYK